MDKDILEDWYYFMVGLDLLPLCWCDDRVISQLPLNISDAIGPEVGVQ